MPFTLAHAVAAFPLRRLGFVFSALILGTFAPDLEYFLRLSPDDGYGHTWKGLFLLTLPLALVTLWLFHAAVKRPVAELLPDGFERRLLADLNGFSFGGPARFSLIVFSIIVGAMTHLAWDSMTHYGTWPYRQWTVLRELVNLPYIGPTPVYKVLQHGSTLVGVAVMSLWVLYWYRQSIPSQEMQHRVLSGNQKARILVSAAAVALVGAVVRTVLVARITPSNLGGKRAVGLMVVTTISLLWWQCVLYGLWRKKFRAADCRPM